LSLYPVFANWATRHGLAAAIDSFRDSLPADQVKKFQEQFEKDRAKVQAGGPPIIAAGPDSWYAGPGQKDRFWPALKRQFEADNWPEDRIQSVDRASSTVVAHTPRPDGPAWNAKGLVVGYVQSGKTTNFTSVIAKLADVEYKMIIVLSGIHNGLRRQTQVRLDEHLRDLNPDNWMTMTGESQDFIKPTQDASAVLTAGPTVLAVVKKNVAILRRVIRWLDTPNGRKALESSPVLVIDDEADQASVATGRINPLIRKLLGLMPRSTYVGYTATPFANVFIDPTQEDLYPKTFILNLPRPEGYFGPEKIFGRDAAEGEVFDDGDDGPKGPPDGYDMVRTVPEDDVPLLRPGGKESAVDFIPTMTDEVVDSVHWFWLATAARRARGDSEHSTMLIHTSVKIAVHESFRSPLEDLQAAALKGLESGDPTVLDRWRNHWEKESSCVPAEDFGRTQNTFDEVLEHLPAVVEATRIVLDNFRSQDRLDYSQPSVVAIAVGGNTLSRGLTLEGLVVSLFVRGATAYDTLLQMGRWFGYRTGYEDLPRIWMTPPLTAAFRHLATVEHEMRDDIDRYQRENLTPTQLAVRIRTHPALRITAKMGAAQPAYVSYAGRRLQTRYFCTQEREWLDRNLQATDALLRESLRYSTVEPLESAYLVRNVSVSLIKNFLSHYQVHQESPDLDPTMMIRYIDKQLEADAPTLEKWSVAVVVSDGPETEIGGLSVRTVIRSQLNDNIAARADIKTLMSKQDRALDLGLSAVAARKEPESALVELRNKDSVHHDRGLLVLYAIDPKSNPRDPDPRPGGLPPARVALDAVGVVIGMGVVFPGNAQQRNRIQATHVAVDLSDVESDEVDEALDQDTEETG
jgi:hypothetical protein